MPRRQKQDILSVSQFRAFLEPLRERLDKSPREVLDKVVYEKHPSDYERAWQLARVFYEHSPVERSKLSFNASHSSRIYSQLKPKPHPPRNQQPSYSDGSFNRLRARFNEVMKCLANKMNQVNFPKLFIVEKGFLVKISEGDLASKEASVAPAVSPVQQPGPEHPTWETVVEIQCGMASPASPDQFDEIVKIVQAPFDSRGPSMNWMEIVKRGPAITVHFTGDYPSVHRIHQVLDLVIQLVDDLAMTTGPGRNVPTAFVHVGIDTTKLSGREPRTNGNSYLTDAVMTAGRLCKHSGPNQILISQSCRDLVENLFDYDYKPVLVTGADYLPVVNAFELIARRSGEPAVEDPIGRKTDLEKLKAYLGSDGITLCSVTGPPGMGKTNLLRGLLQATTHHSSKPLVIACEGRSLEKNSPFFALKRAIRQLMGVEKLGSDQQLHSSITAEALQEFRGQPGYASIRDFACDPSSANGHGLEHVTNWLSNVALARLVLILDRYEVVDSDTAAWVEALIQALQESEFRSRCLVVLSGTSVGSREKVQMSGITMQSIELEYLAPDDARQVLNTMLNRRRVSMDDMSRSALTARRRLIPGEISNAIGRHQRSRALSHQRGPVVMDSSGTPSPDVLEPYLEADDGRMLAVLQSLALLDLPAPHACLAKLLQACRPRDLEARDIEEALHDLIAHDVIVQFKLKGQVNYAFSTSVYHQAALRLIPAEPLPQLRTDIVNILHQEAPRSLERHPQIIAINWEWGGPHCRHEASRAWERAGERLSASELWRKQLEAAQCYANAIRRMDASDPRERLRLICEQIAILAAAGYSPPRRAQLIQEAKGLNASVKDPNREFFLLREDWSSCHNDTQYSQSRRIARDLEIEAQGDEAKQIEAWHCFGLSALADGDLPQSLSAFENAMKKWRPPSSRPLCLWSDHDPGPCCAVNIGLIHSLRGQDTDCQKLVRVAERLVKQARLKRTQAIVLVYSILIAVLSEEFEWASDLLGRWTRVHSHAGRRWAIVKEILMGAVQALAPSTPVQRKEGISRMIEFRNRLEQRHDRALSTFWACFIARGQLDSDAPATALETLNRVSDLSLSERVMRAEFLRLRASANCRMGRPPNDILTDLRLAADTARGQGAHRLLSRIQATEKELEIPMNSDATQ